MKFEPRRAVIALIGFCAFLAFYGPQTLLSLIAEDLQVSPTAAGSLIGTSTVAVAIFGPFAGMLADRMNRKTMLTWATFLLAPPTLLFALAPDLVQMSVWRFMQGIPVPALTSTMVAFIAEEFLAIEAAEIMAYYMAGGVIGGLVGRLLPALLAGPFGWRVGFAVLTIFPILTAIAIHFWLPKPKGRPQEKSTEPKSSAMQDVLLHLRSWPMVATYIIAGIVLGMAIAVLTYINFLLARPPFNLTQAELGLIFLVYLFAFFAQPVTARLINRLGYRTSMSLFMLAQCMGVVIMLAGNFWVIMLGFSVFIVGFFSALTIALGYVGQIATRAKSTAVGLYLCVYYVGGGVGSVAPGPAYEHYGWYGFVAVVLVCLAAAWGLVLQAWKNIIPAAK